MTMRFYIRTNQSIMKALLVLTIYTVAVKSNLISNKSQNEYMKIIQLYSSSILYIIDNYYESSIYPIYVLYNGMESDTMLFQQDISNAMLGSASKNSNNIFYISCEQLGLPIYHSVMFIESYDSLRKSYSNFDNYHSSGRHTIILNSSSTSKQISLKTLFKNLWSSNITNVVVLSNIDNNRSIEIYTYFPFHEENCDRIESTILTKFYLDNPPDKNIILFPNRLTNFHNCSVKVGTFDVKPYIIEEPENNKIKFSGIEARLVQIVSQKLNFNIVYQSPTNNVQWGFIRQENSTGLMKMIQTKEVDLGVACIALSPPRSQYLQSGVPHCISKILFAIPDGRLYTPLEKIVRPLETDTWFALGFSLISFICSTILIHRSSQHHLKMKPVLIINILNMLFGGSNPNPPRQNYARILLFWWIYFSFLIRTIYQGLLFKYLQHDQRWPRLETISDAEKEGLTFYMVDVAERYFTHSPEVLRRYTR